LTVPSEKEAKTFVARVQVGDRIQIPDPVKTVMDLKEGDYVEVTVRKLPKPEEKPEQKSPDKTP
jgi:bifunctional DNA-binding transcriptional regulator/antitoxin component of YhaV-PrlF toxin-antitoxin module